MILINLEMTKYNTLIPNVKQAAPNSSILVTAVANKPNPAHEDTNCKN